MMKNNVYDQFYTNPILSDEIVKLIFNLFPSTKNWKIIEPSAGTGNFINSLINHGVDPKKIASYDIDPKAPNIIKQNYLEFFIKREKKTITIGNPPFGYRGNLALKFLNKALSESQIVAMIFPNTFKRYSIQKKINENAKLIFQKDIPENSFILNNKSYGVKCVFQIWTNNYECYASQKRIKTPPPIKHKDFRTWIHNNTKNTLKYFDKEKYGWNFAVHRQGYYDYLKLIENANDLKENRQYIFIKTDCNETLKVLKEIDYCKLSKTNTQVLGFSTSDLINEYIKMKGE